MSNKRIKVLYIFAGERKGMEKQWQKEEMPDTYFIGLNYMKEFGIDAEYIENKLVNYLRNKNFNLANIILFFKIRKYDVVFSGASLLIIFLTKVIFRFSKPKFVCYNTFLTNLIKNNTGVKAWIIRKTIKSIDAIVCPSKAQKDFLIKQGFSKDKIYFITNGVDVEFIRKKQAELSQEPKEKFILSVGRDAGRDYKTLVEAVKNLDIKVKIIALPRNLKGIDNLPANISVETLPFLKLVELYKQAEFIIIPTKKEENLQSADCSGQYVLLDSLASKQATIASKRSTIYDYVDDQKEAILVEPESPKQLKNAINYLLNNPKKAKELGINAFLRAKEQFTTKIFAKNLAQIFTKLTNRPVA